MSFKTSQGNVRVQLPALGPTLAAPGFPGLLAMSLRRPISPEARGTIMSGEQSVLHVNGVDVNVVDVGEGGPALVFLHFWGGSSRTWGPVIENLSRVARCIAIDFRGWGRSNKDATDHELETLADDVIGVVDALRLEEFTIVGHSMGGKVAQLVAARRPEGLKQLILIAPAPPTSLGVPKEQRQGMLASYQAREGAEQVVGILAARPLSQAHREQVVEDILSGSPDAKRAWPEKGMTQDISAEASRITVPVHVIVGGADNIETEASLRAAFGKVVPGTEFTVLPGVGHLSPLEVPAEVVAAIGSAQVE